MASDGVDCGGPRRSLATIHRVEGAGDLPALPLHGIARAPISFQDLASLTETMAYPALEMGTGQRVGEKASAMAGIDVLGILGTVANGDRRAGATEVEMAAGQTLAVDAEEDDMVVVPDVGPTSCTFAAASPENYATSDVHRETLVHQQLPANQRARPLLGNAPTQTSLLYVAPVLGGQCVLALLAPRSRPQLLQPGCVLPPPDHLQPPATAHPTTPHWYGLAHPLDTHAASSDSAATVAPGSCDSLVDLGLG